MNVLVIGSGGREHALAFKISQSKKLKNLYTLPGNAGTHDVSTNVLIDVEDETAIIEFCKEKNIDLVVIGPELPLSKGLSDTLRSHKINVVGPGKDGARLESSKVWAKDFMFRHGIPTAKFNMVESKDDLLSVVKEYLFPVVIKMDSLQGGKGVFICENKKEVESVSEKIYGELSGEKLIVEEFLKGVEASYMVFCDGKDYVPLPSSKDHKKIYEGEKGPNTGGMGAISPAPVMTDKVIEKAKKKVIEPVIKGLREEGIAYNGIIYAGLMVENESIKVLEFNVRLGDPETQSILTRLETDILDILYPLGKDGRLPMDLDIKWDMRPSVCVVMAQSGYPGKYDKGSEIDFSKFKKEKDVYVFHAGTSLKDGKVLTNGGRVLNVVAISDTLDDARAKVYEKVDSLKWEKAVFRKDIGL